MTIKKIYDNDYSITQYHDESWNVQMGGEKDIPMTLVVEVINMYDATGEEEYIDYPVTFSIGILNKNIHKDLELGQEPGELATVEDVISYYGMNCYIGQKMLDTDLINKKLQESLTISEASTSKYKCRFTKEEKSFLKFKTEGDAFKFAEKLVMQYGNTFMTMLIGFSLDAPINLVGDTGWKNVEILENGE